mgnify:FL=1
MAHDDNSSKASEVIRRRDHVQFFLGKCDPDTGSPRKLMVIWRGSRAVWSGPVDEVALKHPGVVIRDIEIKLPLKSHVNFQIDNSPRGF